MSGYETEELTRIEAALDDLVSPTSEDVFQATRPYDERAIASVAATRAGGGGGGSLPAGITSAADGSLEFAPTDPAVVPLIFRPPPLASSDNESNVIEQYDEDGNLMFYLDAAGEVTVIASPVYSTKFRVDVGDYIGAVGVYSAFRVTDTGAVTIDAGPSGDITLQHTVNGSYVFLDNNGVKVGLVAGKTLSVVNSNQDEIFRVDETDGSVHIKTGTTIVADL